MKARYYFLIILFLINSSVLAVITCSNPREECVEAGGTRMFGDSKDIPFYLPCWKYKTTYECKADSDNNCKQLTAEGCSPASVTCRAMWGGICAVQDMVYDCPDKKCDAKGVVCSDGTGFCLTGNCMSQERSKDNDMYRTLAALSAAADASKDYANNLTIFKGGSSECSKNATGFKNCCGRHSEGWGEGILAECTEEEKNLALKKDAGLAVAIGEYCHNKVLGVCTSYHETYCVFGSKLGRIIRVAANSQFGLGFGDPKNANCRGLTPEEFQRIDFSKIDFSEFYQDIKNKQSIKLADQINPMMQQKAEGLKVKLRGDAQKTIN